jgi:hypothetical protein
MARTRIPAKQKQNSNQASIVVQISNTAAIGWRGLKDMTSPQREAFLARQDTVYLEDNLFSDASMADPTIAQLIIDELQRRDS